MHRHFLEADSDVLLLMKRDELSNLQWVSKVLLFKIKVKTVDILVEVKQDTRLMPAAADIRQQIPFALRRVCNISRPLAVCGGDAQFPILWRSHGLLIGSWGLPHGTLW